MKKLIKLSLLSILCISIFVIITNIVVVNTAKNKTYNSVNSIPKNNVGLILGANKYTACRQLNLFYKYRLEAAVKLFRANKINYIIVSGDNSSVNYDEPNMFKSDLISKGIPENRIFLDFAGFRTLDSVVRAKEIFNQQEFTVISQNFHNQRAIYLAKHHGIKVIGFNAKDVSNSVGLKTYIREYLAKTKAVIDIICHKQPKFLGKKIKIPNV